MSVLKKKTTMMTRFLFVNCARLLLTNPATEGKSKINFPVLINHGTVPDVFT